MRVGPCPSEEASQGCRQKPVPWTWDPQISQRLVTESVSAGTGGNSNFLCPQNLTDDAVGLETKPGLFRPRVSYRLGFWSQAPVATVLSLH